VSKQAASPPASCSQRRVVVGHARDFHRQVTMRPLELRKRCFEPSVDFFDDITLSAPSRRGCWRPPLTEHPVTGSMDGQRLWAVPAMAVKFTGCAGSLIQVATLPKPNAKIAGKNHKYACKSEDGRPLPKRILAESCTLSPHRKRLRRKICLETHIEGV